MATYEQAMAALRKADAAGNVEDARKLARIAQKLKAAPVQEQQSPAAIPEETGSLREQPAPPPPEAGYISQGLSGVNEGIRDTLGLPSTIANGLTNLGASAINAATGTELNPGQPFKNPLDPVFAPTIGPESKDPSKQMVRRIGQEVGAAIIPGGSAVSKATSPMRAAAGALVTSLGSGAGAAVAQQVVPDSILAEIAGSVVGGGSVLSAGALASRMAKNKAVLKSIPGFKRLDAAKNAAYQEVDNIGAKYSPAALNDLADGIKADLQAAGIDPVLNPRAARMAELVEQRLRSGPQSLSELDKLRQAIRTQVVDAAGQHHEGRLAGRLIDNIDEFIDAAGPGQVIGGDPEAAASAITKARQLNTRVRKLDDLQTAVKTAEHRAGSTGSGGNVNNAIRQNIRAILDNPKKVRWFSPDERQMMEGIVMGTKAQNVARQVGKLSPGGNGLQQSLAIGATAMNPLMGVFPVAGIGAKALADISTKAAVTKLQRTIAIGGLRVKSAPLISRDVKRVATGAATASAIAQTADH